MSEPFLAEIRILPYTFAPKGWARCDGQLLPISQNTALFALVGTAYGGDGRTTFALPNLQGRAPMHPGQGPGLSSYLLGEGGGVETVTLDRTQLPVHAHPVRVSTEEADEGTPGPTRVLARSQGSNIYQSAVGPNPVAFANAAVGPSTGQGGPHNNLQPYLAVQFCIALMGIFPSRQ